MKKLHDAVVSTCHIDFHQVLIDDATAADVHVTYLRVTHLALWQTNVEAVGTQLAVV